MTYLIDSDWVADFLKGRTDARALLRELAPSGLAVSVVTYAEILEGINYGGDPERHRQSFQQFLRFVDIVGLEVVEFERFASVRGQVRRTGQIIGDLDILIGVTAVEHGLTLVTRNIRHFNRIPSLVVHEVENK